MSMKSKKNPGDIIYISDSDLRIPSDNTKGNRPCLVLSFDSIQNMYKVVSLTSSGRHGNTYKLKSGFPDSYVNLNDIRQFEVNFMNYSESSGSCVDDEELMFIKKKLSL